MIKPELSTADFHAWCLKHAKSFFMLDEWMATLKSFSLSTGMRFHGNMLTLQSGVPAVCFTIDSRTEELCQSCMVPSITTLELSSVTKEILWQMFFDRFNPIVFDANRSMMARKLMSFLLANDLTPSKHLQDIALGHRPFSNSAGQAIGTTNLLYA
jgi:hypothetical protein